MFENRYFEGKKTFPESKLKMDFTLEEAGIMTTLTHLFPGVNSLLIMVHVLKNNKSDDHCKGLWTAKNAIHCGHLWPNSSEKVYSKVDFYFSSSELLTALY